MAKKTKFNINLAVVIPVLIYMGMIKYIVDLENSKLCPCSATKNRESLKKLLIISLCLSLGMLLLSVLLKDKNMLANLSGSLAILSIGLFIFITVIFFRYEGEMYKAKCDCSDDIKRTIFRYYLYTVYVLIMIQILFMIFYIVLLVNATKQQAQSVVKVNLWINLNHK